MRGSLVVHRALPSETKRGGEEEDGERERYSSGISVRGQSGNHGRAVCGWPRPPHIRWIRKHCAEVNATSWHLARHIHTARGAMICCPTRYLSKVPTLCQRKSHSPLAPHDTAHNRGSILIFPSEQEQRKFNCRSVRKKIDRAFFVVSSISSN